MTVGAYFFVDVMPLVTKGNIGKFGEVFEMSGASGWYVVGNNGKVCGPYDAASIRKFAAAGSIDPQTKISKDKISWHLAGSVKGLFPSAPAPVVAVPVAPPVPVETPQIAKKSSKKKLYLVAGVAVVLLLSIAGGVLLSGGSGQQTGGSPVAENVSEQELAEATKYAYREIGVVLNDDGSIKFDSDGYIVFTDKAVVDGARDLLKNFDNSGLTIGGLKLAIVQYRKEYRESLGPYKDLVTGRNRSVIDTLKSREIDTELLDALLVYSEEGLPQTEKSLIAKCLLLRSAEKALEIKLSAKNVTVTQDGKFEITSVFRVVSDSTVDAEIDEAKRKHELERELRHAKFEGTYFKYPEDEIKARAKLASEDAEAIRALMNFVENKRQDARN